MKNNRIQGFTLIELMVAVVIIGILTSIAVPNYQNSVRKSRREDAKGALVSFANAMERHYTEANTYCDAAESDQTDRSCGTASKDQGSPAIFPKQIPLDSNTKYYDLTISSVGDREYTLMATPRSDGGQNEDECGTLTVTHVGKKGAAKEDGCW